MCWEGEEAAYRAETTDLVLDVVVKLVEEEEEVEEELDVVVDHDVLEVVLVTEVLVVVEECEVVVDVDWKQPRPRAAQHQAFLRMSQESTQGES